MYQFVMVFMETSGSHWLRNQRLCLLLSGVLIFLLKRMMRAYSFVKLGRCL